VHEDFSAHSLRSSLVTEAGRRGIPAPEAMALTGHRSVAAHVGCHRAGAALESPASRLADEESPSCKRRTSSREIVGAAAGPLVGPTRVR
jgi:hypothetical protein